MTEAQTAQEISTLLRQITLKERALINDQLRQTNEVTDQQAMVLQLIGAHPGMIQRELVDVMHRRAATVSAFLKKLEEAGLVERHIPVDNTRNKMLYLTAEGQTIVDQFQAVQQMVDQRLTRGLTGEQRETLLALLGDVKRGLETE